MLSPSPFQNPPGFDKELVNTVRIGVQLDPNVNVNSFQLGQIQLGGLIVNLPPGRGSFTGEFDFTTTNGFILRVVAGVDVQTGQAIWQLTAIDPATGLPVTNPNLSLLPSNTDGSQRGFVSFTVLTADGVTTGTRLTESATVTFNDDTPLETNTVTNTVDATPPTTTTTVTALPNGSYALSWSATDDLGGSGVKESTVFVAVDGGAYSTFLANTTQTSLIYIGNPGDTAQFVVISSDNAGNVEAAPDGVFLPPYDPQINLGGPPSEPSTPTNVPLPAPPPPTQVSTNPLFVQAQKGLPSLVPQATPSDFHSILQPFQIGAFATGFTDSGAGISPLGIAFSPDGQSVYISGGAGRNSLYQFGLASGRRDHATRHARRTAVRHGLRRQRQPVGDHRRRPPR